VGLLGSAKTESRDRPTQSSERARLVYLVLFIFLSVLCLSRWGVSGGNPLGALFSAATSPVRTAVLSLTSSASDRVFSWRDAFTHPQLVRHLELENRRLKERLALFETISGENERLRRALSLHRQSPWESLPADVIGRGSGHFRTLLLNRGTKDGILPDQPVIAAEGLVGRIMAVQPHLSRVLLITDPNSAVGCFAAPIPDEATGVVEGTVSGLGGQDLKFEPAQGQEVPDGTPVFTSALSTIFPAGLRVGVIAGSLNTGYYLQRRYRVITGVEFDSLREVLILTGLNRQEAQVLEAEDSLDVADLPWNGTGETP